MWRPARSIALTVRGADEQAILHGYSVLVIDTAGAHRSLEALPGVIILGGDDPLPAPWRLVEALRYPDVNIFLDVSRVLRQERLEYVRAILPAIAQLRRRRGIPHRVVLEDGDEILSGLDVALGLDLELACHVIMANELAGLPPEVGDAADTILITRGVSNIQRPMSWPTPPSTSEFDLSPGEAALWSREESTATPPTRIRLTGRRVGAREPELQYPDVAVPESRAFVVTRRGTPTGIRARTPLELAGVIETADAAALEGHVRHGDLSRWIGVAIGDTRLAFIRQLEEAPEQRDDDLRAALVRSIRTRYESAADGGSAIG